MMAWLCSTVCTRLLASSASACTHQTCLTECSQLLCCTFDVTCCLYAAIFPFAWSHTPPNYLHTFWMQVWRHLKGQRNIPHQSDQLWAESKSKILSTQSSG